jgi:hypothetical protein
VVFITGGAFTSNAAAYLEGVTNARCEKPFEQDELKRLVSELFSRA